MCEYWLVEALSVYRLSARDQYGFKGVRLNCVHAYMYICVHGYICTCVYVYMHTCVPTTTACYKGTPTACSEGRSSSSPSFPGSFPFSHGVHCPAGFALKRNSGLLFVKTATHRNASNSHNICIHLNQICVPCVYI